MKNRPINEHDEFLLSRLLDDDLPSGEAASLRERLEQEPELRRAYASMQRLDALLTARRQDQPQMDWAQFHSQVMEQVTAEAGHRRVIRLADFLRVSLPLAAAAAIALVVWLWPQGQSVKPQPGGGLPGAQIAQHSDERPDSPAGGSLTEDTIEGRPALVIRYHRPHQPDQDGSAQVRVSYARSDDLLQQYREMDERNKNREPWQTVLASDTRSSPKLDLLVEAPLF